MQDPVVLGLAGWSGAGKTTLVKKMLPLLVARGLRVSTLKHAHHEFEVDLPGKDSWEHRRAGASEVIVCSARRWVQMHELGDAPEPSLAELLRKLGRCDLVLIEGFKQERHLKLEIFRPALGKPPLYPQDERILAVATDGDLPSGHPPLVNLNDAPAVVAAVLDCAEPLANLLARLDHSPPIRSGWV
jgi:molybdopterin-guanine dinucleotide biosynthesis protein B